MLSVQRANIYATLIWRHARTFSTPSWWHQRAANEVRDIASLWKRRAGWRQYWNAASFPLLFLSISATLPPYSSSRDCGALHLPAPFKARNELAPISEARERRWRDEGSRVTSILTLAKAKFDLLLIIRTATLKKFYRPSAVFGRRGSDMNSKRIFA